MPSTSTATATARAVRATHSKGIEVRHRKTCTSVGYGGECPCNPGFQANVYDSRVGKYGKKRIRKTFPTWREAHEWRVAWLRRRYEMNPDRSGRLDKGYSHLRKAAQELDRCLSIAPPPSRAFIRDALEAVYRAEEMATRAIVAA